MLDQLISEGRYRVGRSLARGGMADVRLGLDVSSGHAVAVKHLSSELVRNEEARRLFSAEVQTTAALHHPGVVRVLDSGEAEDLITGILTPYFVMEFVPGHSLSALTRRGEPVPLERALELVDDLLEALAYCHDAGLVHGDIKPGNVIVTLTGHIKLVDFGIARHAAAAEDDKSVVQPFATLRYASPEQAQQVAGDARSDLYSVGCVLYELVAGRPPFVGEPADVLEQHLFDQPAAPSSHNPAVTADIDEIVLRALHKYRDDRYPSAGLMKADVERALDRLRAQSAVAAAAAEPPEAEKVPDWPAVIVLARAREVRRRRLVRAISGVAAALLPIAGFGLFHLRGTPDVDGASAALALGNVADSNRSRPLKGVPTPRLQTEAAMLLRSDADAGLLTVRCDVSTATALDGAGVAISTVSLRAAEDGRVIAVSESESRTTPETQPPSIKPKPDEPKPKPDKPKPDEPKPDEPKPDEPKPAKPPKPDEPKPPKPPKPDEPKPHKPKPPKPEPKPDKPKPDKPKPDKPDKPKPDKPKPDKPKPDKPDKPKPDKPDKPKPDKPKPDKPPKA